MPWTPEEFKEKHNQKLTSTQAKSAARQANAMIHSGVPEGEAIATVNKRFEGKKSLASKMYTHKGKEK